MIIRIDTIGWKTKNVYDLKEESKESEGSPEVKARIRRLQMEQAVERLSNYGDDDVKDASVVITNPTHFAVAIK